MADDGVNCAGDLVGITPVVLIGGVDVDGDGVAAVEVGGRHCVVQGVAGEGGLVYEEAVQRHRKPVVHFYINCEVVVETWRRETLGHSNVLIAVGVVAGATPDRYCVWGV